MVIGAGHNGLVASAYLQASGLRVGVVERRGVVGGAAVTEEMVPGFHFSRASYLLSLLRPEIIRDLQLKVGPSTFTEFLPSFPSPSVRVIPPWLSFTTFTEFYWVFPVEARSLSSFTEFLPSFLGPPIRVSSACSLHLPFLNHVYRVLLGFPG